MNENFFLFFKKFRVPEKLKRLIPRIFAVEEIILLNYLADKEHTAANIHAKFPCFLPSFLKSICKKGYLIQKPKKEGITYQSSPFKEILKVFIKHSSAYQKLSDKDKTVCQECITDWSLEEMAESEEPVYRIIPIEITVPDKRQLIPYYQAKSFIQKSAKLALVDCLCRATFQNCSKPIKVCLALNDKAEYFISNGKGEQIDIQAGIEILGLSEKNGLVHSVNNVESPDYLCNCCECCCVFIQGLKKHGIFTSIGKSGFIAKLDAKMCNRCGLCLDMCLFEAIAIENGSIKINESKCFGCGLCSYHCPRSAIRLILHKN